MTLQAVLGIVLSALYGAVTGLAGALELTKNRIQAWSAALMVLAGVSLLVAAFAWGASWSIYSLLAGLLAIHVTSIRNGLRLHGKITYSHHMVRLGLSGLLLVVWYLR